MLRCVALPLIMKDLANPAWIKAKGLLFLFVGFISRTLLYLEHPTLRVAALLLLAAWTFCGFYYFAFYVLEQHVDPAYWLVILSATHAANLERGRTSLPRLVNVQGTMSLLDRRLRRSAVRDLRNYSAFVEYLARGSNDAHACARMQPTIRQSFSLFANADSS